MRKVPGIATLLCLTAVGCGPLDSASSRVPPPIASPEALQTRRVWTGVSPDFYVSAPSPDGKHITEVDWDTGDLSVIELETGEEHRITDKGTWDELDAWVGYSAFSPDGDRLAYTWLPPITREDGTVFQAAEVRTIRFDGSEVRTIMPHNPDISYVRVEEWSPDGGSILVTAFRTDRSSQIGILSVADGAYRALKTNGWRSGGIAAFSPDGRYVAYDLPGATEPGRDIFLLATDGSSEVPLVTGPEDDQLLGWLPDGSGILFHSRTSELGEIRALRIDGGEAKGEPQQIRSDVWRIDPFGFTRSAFFYGILVEQPQIHVATIDLGAGRVLGDPVLLGDPAEGDSHSGVWSPDGQRVAYVEGRDVFGGIHLVIRSVTGELQRRMRIDLGNARELRWTPDGGGLLLRGTHPEGRTGVYRIDLRAGESELVLGTEYAYTLSPDGQTLYHLEGVVVDAAGHTKIIARDLATGENREIAEVDAPPNAIYGLVPSPDGARLVLSAGDGGPRVLIVSLSRGTVREIYHDEGAALAGVDRTIAWTPDGTAVLWFRPEVGEGGGLWRLPVNGGTPHLLIPAGQLETTGGLSAGELHTVNQLQLSPDGRRLLYTSGQNRGEYWMMTGFEAGEPRSSGSENR